VRITGEATRIVGRLRKRFSLSPAVVHFLLVVLWEVSVVCGVGGDDSYAGVGLGSPGVAFFEPERPGGSMGMFAEVTVNPAAGGALGDCVHFEIEGQLLLVVRHPDEDKELKTGTVVIPIVTKEGRH
jgi:hypothetical protein